MHSSTEEGHLSKLEQAHTTSILQRCQIGCWRILIPLPDSAPKPHESGHSTAEERCGALFYDHPQLHIPSSEARQKGLAEMFLDDTMLAHLGLTEHLTPHECYDFWSSRIVCQESSAQNCGDYERQHLDVVRYTWNHPREGHVRFRCRMHSEFSADGRTLITEAAVDRLASRDTATAILSSDMVKTMIEHVPVGVDVWNKSLQLVESNPACYGKFFKTKEEYFARFAEVSPEFQPDGMSSVLKAQFLLRQAFETGFHSEPWVHQSIHGDPIPATVTFVKLSENYVLVFCHDRREEVKIHAELAQAKEKQEILYDNIPLGLFLWAQGHMIDCNAHLLSLLGVVERDLFLKSPAKFLPHVQANGQFSPQVLDAYQMKATQEGYCKFPFTFITIDGDRIPTEMTIYSVMRDNAPVNYCFARDLRVEMALQEEVEKNLHYMQVVLDSCPLGVSLWVNPDKALYFNEKVYTQLGLNSKEEFQDAGDFFAFSPEYQPCGTSSYDMAYACGNKAIEEGAYTFFWMHIGANEEEIPTEVTLVRTQIKGEDLVLAYVRDLRPENQCALTGSCAEPHDTDDLAADGAQARAASADPTTPAPSEGTSPVRHSLVDIAEELKEHGYK